MLTDEDDCSLEHTALIDASRTDLGPLASFRCTHYGVTCDAGGLTPEQMNEVGTKGGKPVPGSKTETFIKLVKVPVHVPLSGKTMEFDAAGKCVGGW